MDLLSLFISITFALAAKLVDSKAKSNELKIPIKHRVALGVLAGCLITFAALFFARFIVPDIQIVK